jgi:hypothetical protein
VDGVKRCIGKCVPVMCWRAPVGKAAKATRGNSPRALAPTRGCLAKYLKDNGTPAILVACRRENFSSLTARKMEAEQQVPPLRFAPAGMTVLFQR